MATRRRRAPRRKHKKAKLILVLLPIICFVAILAWLFFEEVKQTLDAKPTQTTKSRPAPAERPVAKDTETILDPERRKLEDILKNR